MSLIDNVLSKYHLKPLRSKAARKPAKKRQAARTRSSAETKTAGTETIEQLRAKLNRIGEDLCRVCGVKAMPPVPGQPKTARLCRFHHVETTFGAELAQKARARREEEALRAKRSLPPIPAITPPPKVAQKPSWWGRKILGLHVMSDHEARQMGWYEAPIVILVQGDDPAQATCLYVSSDDEGNRAGAFFLEGTGGRCFYPLRLGEHHAEAGDLSAIAGRTIVGGTHMSAEHAQISGWSKRPFVLELDDGRKLVPTSDPEGNDAGTWFGSDSNGNFAIPSLMFRTR